MKRSVLITLFLILILISNISLASYATVTMTVVEEPVCTIEIGENSSFEKRLVEKNLNNKEVTLQLQVTNEEASLQPTGEVMLVIDNSQSMEDIVEGTTTREDLVIESANTLVNTILEGNDNLKVGVVSFSTNADVSKEGTIEDANLVSELSSDPQALTSAISNIQYTGPRTDLQSGLSLATQYFTEEDNNKYIIVLTDGIPNVALDYDGIYFSVISPIFCNAAINISMNVPDVVNITIIIMANMATEGPASQSQRLTPRKECSVSAAGPCVIPKVASRLWTIPRGSWNQLGPSTPNTRRIAFTLPEALKRNSHNTVIATELVTDGK